MNEIQNTNSNKFNLQVYNYFNNKLRSGNYPWNLPPPKVKAGSLKYVIILKYIEIYYLSEIFFLE